ncbi:hypothetical protein E8L99_15480 [Phreatobacter aquaticus]|uniref:Uncharacterized protein n=1 Tax=Phreatobacter aquaticus TaxID=2570229 RepID=A0A4D7QP59_9HYPH|nr:hypothetical protein [Phreatobacter aquaticus]QCK87064.1 hypothetical protein E8L99_15480 [Phreatobacter aquaticus]
MAPAPLRLFRLVMAAALVAAALPAVAQDRDPFSNRVGRPLTQENRNELAPLVNEPLRRRRHTPGGAAAPFFSLPDTALPFAPQTGTNPALMLPGTQPRPNAVTPQFTDRTPVALDAKFGANGQYIRDGLYWRVFSDRPEADGAFALVAESRDAAPTFALRPGGYILHAAYGTYAIARRMEIGTQPFRDTVAMNAGALRLAGKVGDRGIGNARLSFDIFSGGLFEGGEPKLVMRQAPAGDLIALPEGTYHVVSVYGDANALIRADIRIRAGQVTDATIHHRAANISLRLVQGREGGEPIGNAAWTVLTPGGDVIKESIGAYPQMVLQEGEYLAIARHEGRVFNRKFQVEAGKDLQIEVVAR